jgi:signal transduction histidine kinase
VVYLQYGEHAQRLGADRTGHRQGHGLGLSIVAAVAAAHQAELRVRARPDGGLQVVVGFPTPDGTPPADEPMTGHRT